MASETEWDDVGSRYENAVFETFGLKTWRTADTQLVRLLLERHGEDVTIYTIRPPGTAAEEIVLQSPSVELIGATVKELAAREEVTRSP